MAVDVRLYKTGRGAVLQDETHCYLHTQTDWDRLINRDDLYGSIREEMQGLKPLPRSWLESCDLLPPIGSQEVWAAGVTYYRSRDARMEEARGAGGGDFYDRVYHAERPELFFKASPHRVAGHRQTVRIRHDSSWNVPEPELTLLITCNGRIVGYTIGNDVSSRDIEGENPLYLPQAKVYDRSCALGPAILVKEDPLPGTTSIDLEIARGGKTVFQGSTTLSEMKKSPEVLVEYLFRHNSFPQGCFLLTGTGIVPAGLFSLQREDEIHITIEPIGTLTNRVE